MRCYIQAALLSLLASTFVAADDPICVDAFEDHEISRADAQSCVDELNERGSESCEFNRYASIVCTRDSGRVIVVYDYDPDGPTVQSSSSFGDIGLGLQDILDSCPGDPLFAVGPVRGNGEAGLRVGDNELPGEEV